MYSYERNWGSAPPTLNEQFKRTDQLMDGSLNFDPHTELHGTNIVQARLYNRPRL